MFNALNRSMAVLKKKIILMISF